MSTLDPDAGVTLPPLEAEPTEDGTGGVQPVSVSVFQVFTSSQSDSSSFVLVLVFKESPHTIKEDSLYDTVLACWASQEEADTDSSNEEEDTGASHAPSGADGPMEGDPASNPPSNANKYVYSTTVTTTTILHPPFLLTRR